MELYLSDVLEIDLIRFNIFSHIEKYSDILAFSLTCKENYSYIRSGEWHLIFAKINLPRFLGKETFYLIGQIKQEFFDKQIALFEVEKECFHKFVKYILVLRYIIKNLSILLSVISRLEIRSRPFTAKEKKILSKFVNYVNCIVDR